MQAVRVLGAWLVGTGAELVTVEAHFAGRRAQPERERTEIVVSGLPDPVIRESRGRLMCALQANGMILPSGRLFLNLVPATRRKSGEILDLPLALGAACSVGHITPRLLRNTLFLGELGIDGRLHAVGGGFAVACAAKAAGIQRILAPPATAQEAAHLPGIQAFGANNLSEVFGHVSGAQPLAPLKPAEQIEVSDSERQRRIAQLDEVRGQETAKQALAVAAAGGHALLLLGSPGAGKSMLAERLRGLLSPPDQDERMAITQVLSACGRWPGKLASERPFRAPHHTTSHAGLVGGGSPPRPGEITLAHNGVLFLDELPEFKREALEALRQPLESGQVTLSRAGHQAELPARFQLVCAMNPCPCGYRGHPRTPCRCPDSFVERYVRRISGPLIDRMDLRVEVHPPQPGELLSHSVEPRDSGQPRDSSDDPASGSAQLMQQVERARSQMRKRQGSQTNARLSGSEIDRFAALNPSTRDFLRQAAELRGLSARGIQSVRRVARTIADLEGRAELQVEQLAKALFLRAPLLEPQSNWKVKPNSPS